MKYCNVKKSEGMTAPAFQDKRTASLMVASEKMVEFINEWCCPHDVVVIEQGSVRLYCGESGFPTKVLD